MLHKIINTAASLFTIEKAAAHCDIPCKIYDPVIAQVAALSIIRFQDLIGEIDGKDSISTADHVQLARLTHEKEVHAAKVKNEVCTIWGDYFKQPQFEKFPQTNELVHSIMLTASSCKQGIDRKSGEKLLELVNEFAEIFWSSKGVATFSATSPYPPSELVIYPKLS